MTVALAIPAAGEGNRFSKEIKKQFYQIDNKPILYFTLKRMVSVYPFDEIILGINESDRGQAEDIVNAVGPDMPVIFAKGGRTRAHTVMNCLEAASSELILVHDAVRPFAGEVAVKNVIAQAAEFGGAAPALKIRDTIKRAENGEIKETVDRDGLYLAHTPQGFKRTLLIKAMTAVLEKGVLVTDEASAVEFSGGTVRIVPSSWDNIKITYMEDMETVNMLKDKYFG